MLVCDGNTSRLWKFLSYEIDLWLEFCLLCCDVEEKRHQLFKFNCAKVRTKLKSHDIT